MNTFVTFIFIRPYPGVIWLLMRIFVSHLNPIIMALLKMSSLAITDLSGKAGGSVYAKNKGGAYIRNFAVPNNPKTLPQVAVRGQFGANSQLWRQLTQEQRDAWNQAAANFPYVNRVGDSKILSGQSLYIKLNQNLQNVGAARLTSPPMPQGPDQIDVLTVTADVSTGTGLLALAIMATFNAIAANPTSVLVFSTPVVSPGITNVNNRYRLLGFAVQTAITTGTDFGDEYATVFGIPEVGGKIGLRLVAVNSETGERGADVQINVIVGSVA